MTNDARIAARRLVDAQKIEQADLNISMVLIQLGRATEGEAGLREILLRTQDSSIAFSAAYNLAAALRKQGRYEKAWSYADRAMEYALELNNQQFVATCYNLRGNIQLNQNFYDGAMAAYEKAAAIHSSSQKPNLFSLAILKENTGYCLLMKGQWDAGIGVLNDALQMATEIQDHRCEAECLQDLCYAHLMQHRLDQALNLGAKAYSLSMRYDYKDILENSHYLLGELGSRMEDWESRDRHFDALQKMHPELPFLKDFLCTVDVTRLITLKR